MPATLLGRPAQAVPGWWHHRGHSSGGQCQATAAKAFIRNSHQLFLECLPGPLQCHMCTRKTHMHKVSLHHLVHGVLLRHPLYLSVSSLACQGHSSPLGQCWLQDEARGSLMASLTRLYALSHTSLGPWPSSAQTSSCSESAASNSPSCLHFLSDQSMGPHPARV